MAAMVNPSVHIITDNRGACHNIIYQFGMVKIDLFGYQ
jgi:hypothetical protein